MKFLRFILFLCVCSLLLCNCKSKQQVVRGTYRPETRIGQCLPEKSLAEQAKERKLFEISQTLQKMNEMTGEDCVFFYVNNRYRCDYLDSLFEENIVPKLLCGTFYDIKEIRNKVANTPVSEYFEEQYQVLKNELLMDIANEIDERGEIQKEAFVNEIIPILELEIDSLFANDFKNVLEDYSGGFLNYKKLGFWFGRDSETFGKKWRESVDNKKYNKINQEYFDMFIQNINEWNKKYYYDIIDKPYYHTIDFQLPMYRLYLPQSILTYVDEYTNKESKSMAVSGIKDFLIPVVLGAISAGTLALVYDGLNFGYDVAEIYDEIKNAKLGEEELLEYKSENILNNSYKDKYLSQCIDAVFNMIDNESEYLYNRIENEL